MCIYMYYDAQVSAVCILVAIENLVSLLPATPCVLTLVHDMYMCMYTYITACIFIYTIHYTLLFFIHREMLEDVGKGKNKQSKELQLQVYTCTLYVHV